MRAVGIVLAGGRSGRMRELTDRRAVAAMPVAGSFRCIDFVLSSMSNSRIQSVAVLPQYNSRSLSEHVSSPRWWDFGRKQGGLFVLTPTITPENQDWYRGTADALYQNLDFLRRSREPYAVIASGDCVYKLDYREVLKYHIQKKADITLVCTRPDPGEDLSRFGQVTADENGWVTGFAEKPAESVSQLISCGIYVIHRRLLIELLAACAAEGCTDFVQGILLRHLGEKRVGVYMMDGYFSNIASVSAYYRTNMDFLKPEVRQYFFREYPGISTKTDDLPPAKYNPGAALRNSLAANGCMINGTVENSVLFHGVFVGSGCMIRSSIILNDVCIGDHSVIENCIVESRTTLAPKTLCQGSQERIRIVREESGRYWL